MKKNKKKNFTSKINKLFVDIGLLDFVALLLFFLIMVFAALFLLRKSEYTIITLRLYEREGAGFWHDLPNQIYVENLKTGLVEKDESGRTVLEVLEVDRVLSNDIRHDIKVKLKMKTTFNKRTGRRSYDGLQLLVGNFYTFKLESLELSGVILSIGEDLAIEETKDFVIEGYLISRNEEELWVEGNQFSKINGVKKYISDYVYEGMEIIDSNGASIVKVLEVNKELGSREYVSNGSWIKQVDYDREQVYLKILVKANKINDAYYYQFTAPLVVANDLRLVFDNIVLMPIITKIEAVDE